MGDRGGQAGVQAAEGRHGHRYRKLESTYVEQNSNLKETFLPWLQSLFGNYSNFYYIARLKKHISFLLTDAASTLEVSLPASSSSSLCMPEETFVAVARMAVEVEKAFGGPRDVEFAVKDGKMYLLQVNPPPPTFKTTFFFSRA